VTTLGIDTATSATAVALRQSDGSISEARDDPAPGAHPGHATELLSMAEGLLSEATLGWEQLQKVAVGIGPGTFTGLRVGLATARGLAQSLGVGLAPVSSLRALAEPALAGEHQAHGSAVVAMIDARRGEVFVAVYARPDGRELMAPIAIPPAAIASVLEAAGGELGGSSTLAVGDGALRYRQQLIEQGIELAPEGSPLHLLRASAICRLADLAAEAGDYGQVLPDYCRRPDAELALTGPGAPA
jgi:tRNA threonylcarbamoyladenosine biosynthesis protein TsaB